MFKTDAFENFMTWFQKTEHVYVLHATSAAYSVSQLSLYHRQYSSHSAAGRVESFFPSMDGISAWGGLHLQKSTQVPG